MRREELDICKGIGIILVIVGHLLPYGYYPSRVIFSFHMPLFFMVAGVFASEYPKFTKIIKHTVLPYFAFLLVGLVTFILQPSWQSRISVSEIKTMVYSGQPEIFGVGQIWFLMCLFWVEMAYMILHKIILSKTQGRYPYVVIEITLFIMLYFYQIKREDIFTHWDRLPLKIDTAIIGLFFYLLGYSIKNEILSQRKVNAFIPLLGCITVLGCCIFSGEMINICSMATGTDLGFFIIVAFIGSISTVYISKWLWASLRSKAKTVLFGLSLLGRQSLIAFGLHSFGITLYELLYRKVTGRKIIHLSNLTYLEVLLGTAFVTFLTLLTCLAWEKIRHLKRGSH